MRLFVLKEAGRRVWSSSEGVYSNSREFGAVPGYRDGEVGEPDTKIDKESLSVDTEMDKILFQERSRDQKLEDLRQKEWNKDLALKNPD